MIKLYAERSQLKGFAFSADDSNQEEFDNDFPYVETEDQLRSIQEVKKDMESSCPMDRLLVGDVGFGKTEVAMRAAFKAVNDHKLYSPGSAQISATFPSLTIIIH